MPKIDSATSHTGMPRTGTPIEQVHVDAQALRKLGDIFRARLADDAGADIYDILDEWTSTVLGDNNAKD